MHISSRKFTRNAALLALASFACCDIYSQEISPETLRTATVASVRNSLWSGLNTGPDGNLLGDDSAVVVQFYDKNQKVNLNYALPTSVFPGSAGKPHVVWSYKLSADAPANPDDKDNPLPTLDGLRNAYAVGFSFNYSRIPAVSQEEIAEYSSSSNEWKAEAGRLASRYLSADSTLSEACVDQMSDQLPFNLRGDVDLSLIFGSNVSGIEDWRQVAQLRNFPSQRAALVYTKMYLESLARASDAQREQLDVLQNLGDYLSFDTTMTDTCMSEYVERYIHRTWSSDRYSQTYALEAKTGIEAFDILDPLNFGARTENKQVHSLALSMTLFKTSSRGSKTFTASYTHQQSYEAATEETICIQDPATSQQACKNGVFAAPTQSDKIFLSLDFRTRFPNVFGDQPVALQVKVTRDFSADLSGVDIPVHLFSVGGEELNAGLRFGWESKTDEGKVGVFFGQKF